MENVGESTFNGKDELLRYINSAYNGIAFKTEHSINENHIIVEIGQLVVETNGEVKKTSYCNVWKFQVGLLSHIRSFVT